MDQEYLGIIIFFTLTLASAFLFHYRNDGFWVPSLLAAVAAAIFYQVIGFFVLGHLDPFFIIAFMNSALIALSVSAIVGLQFVYLKKIRKS